MYLEKDLPIIGANPISIKALGQWVNGLVKFSERRPLFGQSYILDAKGIPFGGTGKITFRRYNKFKAE